MGYLLKHRDIVCFPRFLKINCQGQYFMPVLNLTSWNACSGSSTEAPSFNKIQKRLAICFDSRHACIPLGVVSTQCSTKSELYLKTISWFNQIVLISHIRFFFLFQLSRSRKTIQEILFLLLKILDVHFKTSLSNFISL